MKKKHFYWSLIFTFLVVFIGCSFHTNTDIPPSEEASGEDKTNEENAVKQDIEPGGEPNIPEPGKQLIFNHMTDYVALAEAVHLSEEDFQVFLANCQDGNYYPANGITSAKDVEELLKLMGEVRLPEATDMHFTQMCIDLDRRECTFLYTNDENQTCSFLVYPYGETLSGEVMKELTPVNMNDWNGYTDVNYFRTVKNGMQVFYAKQEELLVMYRTRGMDKDTAIEVLKSFSFTELPGETYEAPSAPTSDVKQTSPPDTVTACVMMEGRYWSRINNQYFCKTCIPFYEII